MKETELIVVKNVSKKFSKSLKLGLAYGLKDLFFSHQHGQLRRGEFWSVKGISFTLKRGECLGIIGHNGAGKSTLLKMLSGLLPPDEGEIRINGSMGSLIELGAGFNPILTGRENIFANASMLGFSRKQTEEKLAEIIEFAELGEFIDMPLQNYSSGMQVRLGFAVAAQLKPDILLIDEVLAVGDMGFVIKCVNHIDRLMKDTAVIFVSHSMPQISRMATKIMLLEKGRSIIVSEDSSKVISQYYNLFDGEVLPNYNGNNIVTLDDIYFKTSNVKEIKGKDACLNIHENYSLTMVLNIRNEIFRPEIHLSFLDKEQRNFAEINNFSVQKYDLKWVGLVKVEINLGHLNFAQGIYSITIGMSSFNAENYRTILFRIQSAISFKFDNTIHGWAPIQLQPNWSIVKMGT